MVQILSIFDMYYEKGKLWLSRNHVRYKQINGNYIRGIQVSQNKFVVWQANSPSKTLVRPLKEYIHHKTSCRAGKNKNDYEVRWLG